MQLRSPGFMQAKMVEIEAAEQAYHAQLRALWAQYKDIHEETAAIKQARPCGPVARVHSLSCLWAGQHRDHTMRRAQHREAAGKGSRHPMACPCGKCKAAVHPPPPPRGGLTSIQSTRCMLCVTSSVTVEKQTPPAARAAGQLPAPSTAGAARAALHEGRQHSSHATSSRFHIWQRSQLLLCAAVYSRGGQVIGQQQAQAGESCASLEQNSL